MRKVSNLGLKALAVTAAFNFTIMAGLAAGAFAIALSLHLKSEESSEGSTSSK